MVISWSCDFKSGEDLFRLGIFTATVAEQPSYFPTESVDKRIGWQQKHPGYDLYDSGSAAAQLGISKSFFRESVKSDSSAPVIVGRGMIACNTPALQEWWDGKKHHRVTGER